MMVAPEVNGRSRPFLIVLIENMRSCKQPLRSAAFQAYHLDMDDSRPQWDQRLADQLDGAVVLVGMTYNEPDGQRVEQFYGTVIATHENEGVTLSLDGTRSGETFRLPPDLRAFYPAKPGSYRLRTTGEVVVDPDFTTTWERNAPQG